MKIVRVEFSIKVDLADVPAYHTSRDTSGRNSWLFKPDYAMVTDSGHTVIVWGHRIQRGGPHPISSTVTYPSGIKAPEFVGTARRTALDFITRALERVA